MNLEQVHRELVVWHAYVRARGLRWPHSRFSPLARNRKAVLTDMCACFQLPVHGTKQELVQRLLHWGEEPIVGEPTVGEDEGREGV